MCGCNAKFSMQPRSKLTGKTPAEKIVLRARQEAKQRTLYDASYQQIRYPGGDVPAGRGACTDVIVRALRAVGYDLQKLIHDDKKAHPARYPQDGGLGKLDGNIDHRRISNHIAYLKSHAISLTKEIDAGHLTEWQPGDLVYFNLGDGQQHCGIISDLKNDQGTPLVIHNLGPTASENDCLGNWEIIGHFRMPH